MRFYNPHNPAYSEAITCWYEYDAQINMTSAFTFNAANLTEAIAVSKQYGASKLTQFTRPCRIVTTINLKKPVN